MMLMWGFRNSARPERLAGAQRLDVSTAKLTPAMALWEHRQLRQT